MHASTSIVGKEVILGAEYGNEHDNHAVAGMNDAFVVGHVPVLCPDVLGI